MTSFLVKSPAIIKRGHFSLESINCLWINRRHTDPAHFLRILWQRTYLCHFLFCPAELRICASFKALGCYPWKCKEGPLQKWLGCFGAKASQVLASLWNCLPTSLKESKFYYACPRPNGHCQIWECRNTPLAFESSVRPRLAVHRKPSK